MPPNNTSKQGNLSVAPLPRNIPLNPIFRRARMATSRNLRRERERLRTFEHWPRTFLKPADLAAEGFYYTGEADVVRCAFCGVEIGCWEEGDSVRNDHLKWSSKCDFVLKRPCGNIPVSDDDSSNENDSGSYDTCGPFSSEIRPFSGPERDLDSNSLWKDLEHLGVSKTSGPVRPYYATYESRLATFTTWPTEHPQRPEALAKAGFYYLKFADHTICFHCGGGLKDWEAEDDPWVEHARWFSKCGFILIQKGREWVHDVLSKNKAILSWKVVKELEPPLKVEGEDETSSETTPVNEEEKAVMSDTTEVKEEENENAEKSSETEVAGAAAVLDKKEDTVSENKDYALCVICYSQEREIVFLPCGHFVACVKCAPSLATCALCRKPYQATIRAYFS